MKWLFFITHTIHQTEIPTLLDSWATNTPFVKMFQTQENCLSLCFIIFTHFSMTVKAVKNLQTRVNLVSVMCDIRNCSVVTHF